MTKYEIDVIIVEELIKYLETCPKNEVKDLISKIKSCKVYEHIHLDPYDLGEKVRD